MTSISGPRTDTVFSMTSHLAGTLLSIAGAVLLIVAAAAHHKPWQVVSFGIYGASLVAVFLTSTLHHGQAGRTPIFKKLDYIAIFLLIAGTMTPLCLVSIRNQLGWSIFGLEWGFVALGVGLELVGVPPYVSRTIYFSMGFLGVLLIPSIAASMGWPGVFLLVAGAVFYTGGAILTGLGQPNLLPGIFEHHDLWHVFVLLGAFCHYLMMYLFVLPHP
ncbi:MAG: PAQR family membrane homeostasis protein TrhA [Candidatus Xenobia bacterium]